MDLLRSIAYPLIYPLDIIQYPLSTGKDNAAIQRQQAGQHPDGRNSMRVLFYLPVITPWWFDNIVGGMIKTLSPVFDVHVIVPSLWSGTGIGQDQIVPLLDQGAVTWHVLDSGRSRHMRTSAQ